MNIVSIFPNFIKNYIKKIIKKLYSYIEYKENLNEDKLFLCPVCNNKINNFLPLDSYYFHEFDTYGFVHSLFQFETLNILQYSCPVCNSLDRTRMFALYIRDLFSKLDPSKRYSFLDIAPHNGLQKIISSYSNIDYRSADLFKDNVDDNVDITNMNIYTSESFDFILCSHVLEHIEQDKQAIREIYRVLKNGGLAIIMVPILLTLSEDLENPEWVTFAERWKYYGQDDHVRLYSKVGFVNKLQEAGFRVEQLDREYFGQNIFALHGINNRSVLYIVKK